MLCGDNQDIDFSDYTTTGEKHSQFGKTNKLKNIRLDHSVPNTMYYFDRLYFHRFYKQNKNKDRVRFSVWHAAKNDNKSNLMPLIIQLIKKKILFDLKYYLYFIWILFESFQKNIQYAGWKCNNLMNWKNHISIKWLADNRKLTFSFSKIYNCDPFASLSITKQLFHLLSFTKQKLMNKIFNHNNWKTSINYSFEINRNRIAYNKQNKHLHKL